ncbi:hypothetical protein NYO91_07360 [Arhodomonas aquaeolei]|uniref:hypothetical protein n=1 Tax=Arhodomonas aquaeolei TaxID=2369 RepID=UPI0021670E3E|nr:hypothetical protein [Arhodomonas aquaeolei]MCS4503894.1 hypothetical protein [Arhodomonas aquaeolei]
MSRTVTWSPEPGELFTLPETAEDVSYAITVEVEEEDAATGEPQVIAVENYTGTITPEQTVMDIAGSADALTVSADSLVGLFPIESIEYLLGGELGEVDDWGDLPAEAEEVIAFKPSTDTEYTFTLDVTAHLEDGTTESASYELVVQQDWTAGRDRLKAEVDARR